MKNQTLKHSLLQFALLLMITMTASGSNIAQPDLVKAIDNSSRSAKNKARDYHRHPLQTLQFLGIEPNMHVVEIWPGSGWYTEILAPYLKDNGRFYAAHFDPMLDNHRLVGALQRYEEKILDNDIYSKTLITVFNPPEEIDIAPPGSADMVLTFRNLHNWLQKGEPYFIETIKAMHKALKPGGILGVVEHRLNPSIVAPKGIKGGYVREDYTIKMIESAGFELVASSELNANALDSTNHPKGVWTLPPRLALGEKDREKYLSVGESDRMTLKFIKL